jgi:hypothetical protein
MVPVCQKEPDLKIVNPGRVNYEKNPDGFFERVGVLPHPSSLGRSYSPTEITLRRWISTGRTGPENHPPVFSPE